jgi:hypothetical protein
VEDDTLGEKGIRRRGDSREARDVRADSIGRRADLRERRKKADENLVLLSFFIGVEKFRIFCNLTLEYESWGAVWGVANWRWEIGRRTAGKTAWDRGGGLQGRG